MREHFATWNLIGYLTGDLEISGWGLLGKELKREKAGKRSSFEWQEEATHHAEVWDEWEDAGFIDEEV
jgi:hypothetical protein